MFRSVKQKKLGMRAEIKNIGSISNIGLAIQKEVERQQEIYEMVERFKRKHVGLMRKKERRF